MKNSAIPLKDTLETRSQQHDALRTHAAEALEYAPYSLVEIDLGLPKV